MLQTFECVGVHSSDCYKYGDILRNKKILSKGGQSVLLFYLCHLE